MKHYKIYKIYLIVGLILVGLFWIGFEYYNEQKNVIIPQYQPNYPTNNTTVFFNVSKITIPKATINKDTAFSIKGGENNTRILTVYSQENNNYLPAKVVINKS